MDCSIKHQCPSTVQFDDNYNKYIYISELAPLYVITYKEIYLMWL